MIQKNFELLLQKKIAKTQDFLDTFRKYYAKNRMHSAKK